MMINTTPEHHEWNQARTAFYQAQHNFDHATGAYVDIAIKDLEIAEARMDNALRKLQIARQEVHAV